MTTESAVAFAAQDNLTAKSMVATIRQHTSYPSLDSLWDDAPTGF